MSTEKLRNIGPKSAAWLRQVGLRSREDLTAVGTVEAFMRVKRAGFKPTLNLLYAIEGALRDCHWQEVPDARRTELVSAAEAAIALLPPPRHRPAAGLVRTTVLAEDTVAGRPDGYGSEGYRGDGRYRRYGHDGHGDEALRDDNHREGGNLDAAPGDRESGDSALDNSALGDGALDNGTLGDERASEG